LPFRLRAYSCLSPRLPLLADDSYVAVNTHFVLELVRVCCS
jgi:hypothetical protein